MVMPPMCPGAEHDGRWRFAGSACALYIHLSGAPMNAVNPIGHEIEPYRSLMSYHRIAHFARARQFPLLKLDAHRVSRSPAADPLRSPVDGLLSPTSLVFARGGLPNA